MRRFGHPLRARCDRKGLAAPVTVVMGVERIELAGALAAIVADPPRAEDLPERLCTACLSVLPVDGVGLSLMTRTDSGGRTLLGASGEVGAKIEQLQFDLGEGPCVSAFSEAQPVLISDLEATEVSARWPLFAHEARSTGVRALFAFPMQVGTIAIGVLDCHRMRPGALDDVSDALTVTDAVTMALLNFHYRASEGRDAVELFDVSWRSHAVVHQATGMLSAQLDIRTDEALAILRAHAFRWSRPVDAVASDLVARRLHLPQENQ